MRFVTAEDTLGSPDVLYLSEKLISVVGGAISVYDCTHYGMEARSELEVWVNYPLMGAIDCYIHRSISNTEDPTPDLDAC
jgi:hypothetical protein